MIIIQLKMIFLKNIIIINQMNKLLNIVKYDLNNMVMYYK